MKVLVLIKRTPSRELRVAIGPDGLPLLGEIEFEINPFDEIAVEAALVIAETRGAETVAATVGGSDADAQLLTALAMGIDRSLRIDVAAAGRDTRGIAELLHALALREEPDLVLAGKLSVDEENGQVPGMLAGLLDWPLANQASRIDVRGEGEIRVECEVDDGIEIVDLGLPAIVTADLRLAEPRYASLPGIMKAKRKPREVIAAAELAKAAVPVARLAGFQALPPRKAGVRVSGAGELVARLRERGLI